MTHHQKRVTDLSGRESLQAAKELALGVPAPQATTVKFSRWQRLKIWWHQRRLRRASKIARKFGLALIELGQYRMAIDGLVDIASYIEHSGGLTSPRRIGAKKKLEEKVRNSLYHLSLGEKLASEAHFLETIQRVAIVRRRQFSNRERRAAHRRPQLIDAVGAMNRRFQKPIAPPPTPFQLAEVPAPA